MEPRYDLTVTVENVSQAEVDTIIRLLHLTIRRRSPTSSSESGTSRRRPDVADLMPYSEYAHRASLCLTDAEDWLRSDWPAGQGPTDDEADCKSDAIVLIRYALAALRDGYRLTPEARRALRGEEG